MKQPILFGDVYRFRNFKWHVKSIPEIVGAIVLRRMGWVGTPWR